MLTSIRQAGAALVIATDRGVCGRSWSRLGWEDVDQVLWDDDVNALTPTRTGHGGPARVALRRPRHRPLVELAGERVISTTLARAPVLSGGRVCGWLTARRRPGLPGASGIAATGLVRQASPDTAVLVLTAHNDVICLRRAFAAGAAGFLLKEAADIDLVQAVRTVASGRQYVHPTLGAAALHIGAGPERPAGPGGQLSERELEVLRGIASGHTNADIAAAMHLSVRTVESHRAHIQRKLGARTRAELVEHARAAHLLADEELP